MTLHDEHVVAPNRVGTTGLPFNGKDDRQRAMVELEVFEFVAPLPPRKMPVNLLISVTPSSIRVVKAVTTTDAP